MGFHAGAKEVLALSYCDGLTLVRHLGSVDPGFGGRAVYLYLVLVNVLVREARHITPSSPQQVCYSLFGHLPTLLVNASVMIPGHYLALLQELAAKKLIDGQDDAAV
jgi:hypothetical protein